MVSHDASDILSWADIILVMKDGQLIQQGTPGEIYRQPVNEYGAGLFGEYNLLGEDVLPGIITNGKRAVIRPEDIHITTGETNDIRGFVKNILFRGNYYSADVWTEKQTIRVQTNNDQLVVGDKVWLYISHDKIWYI